MINPNNTMPYAYNPNTYYAVNPYGVSGSTEGVGPSAAGMGGARAAGTVWPTAMGVTGARAVAAPTSTTTTPVLPPPPASVSTAAQWGQIGAAPPQAGAPPLMPVGNQGVVFQYPSVGPTGAPSNLGTPFPTPATPAWSVSTNPYITVDAALTPD